MTPIVSKTRPPGDQRPSPWMAGSSPGAHQGDQGDHPEQAELREQEGSPCAADPRRPADLCGSANAYP